jgi:hypothetical protein
VKRSSHDAIDESIWNLVPFSEFVTEVFAEQIRGNPVETISTNSSNLLISGFYVN